MTVGAINNQKSITQFSNHGSCVNIWALGVSVISLWPNGKTKILDGTSASAPNVAGHLALMWEANPRLLPVALYQKLLKSSIFGLFSINNT